MICRTKLAVRPQPEELMSVNVELLVPLIATKHLRGRQHWHDGSLARDSNARLHDLQECMLFDISKTKVSKGEAIEPSYVIT